MRKVCCVFLGGVQRKDGITEEKFEAFFFFSFVFHFDLFLLFLVLLKKAKKKTRDEL